VSFIIHSDPATERRRAQQQHEKRRCVLSNISGRGETIEKGDTKKTGAIPRTRTERHIEKKRV